MHIVGDNALSTLTDGESGVNIDIAEYEIVSPYTFGDSVPQITEKYFSNCNYYDSDTHYYLGQYLRCLRDIYGVDLMPFYNCFNYKAVHNLYLSLVQPDSDTENFYGYVEKSSDAYKIFAVPIKFDTTYTIAVDCDAPVYLKSVFYGKLGLLKARVETGVISLSEVIMEDNGTSITVKSEASFTQPFTYSISSDSHRDVNNMSSKDMKEYEKSLYLLIQLPADNDSSIAVIEGDYTFRGNTKIFNLEDPNTIEDMDDESLNRLLISNLQLLQLNDRKTYAFSNRLIEYLLLNVIDSLDEISQNTERVQKYVGLLSSKSQFKGVWNKYLRSYLYNLYMSNRQTTKIDINGFVDRNIEKLNTKGWEV